MAGLVAKAVVASKSGRCTAGERETGVLSSHSGRRGAVREEPRGVTPAWPFSLWG